MHMDRTNNRFCIAKLILAKKKSLGGITIFYNVFTTRVTKIMA